METSNQKNSGIPFYAPKDMLIEDAIRKAMELATETDEEITLIFRGKEVAVDKFSTRPGVLDSLGF